MFQFRTASSFNEPLLNASANEGNGQPKTAVGTSSMAVSIINCIKNIIGAGNKRSTSAGDRTRDLLL